MRKKKETSDTQTYSKKNTQANKKSKNQHSILQMHEIKLLEFANKAERLKSLDTKINNLETSINKLTQELRIKNKNQPLCNTRSVITKHQEKIAKLQIEKDLIKNGQDEIDYLLESSNIIMEYIKIEEQEALLLNVNDLSEQNSLELNNINFQKNNL